MATRKTMNISLPPALKTWIDRQVVAGGYGTASEFIRDLVRQARARQDDLEKSLLRAMKEPGREMTDEDWEAIRREGKRHLESVRSNFNAARHPRRKSA